MQLENLDIKTLLPQQVPFVMVDTLLRCDNIVTQTRFYINEGHVFTSNGVLTEPGILENIAQTCAARMGYINSIMKGGDVKLGFIGAVKNMKFYKLPPVGSSIETSIEVQNEVFNMLLVQAKVFAGNECIAECEMKISEQ